MPKVGGANDRAGFFAGLGERRDKDAEEYGDNGDANEEFDEGEGAVWSILRAHNFSSLSSTGIVIYDGI